LRVRTARLDEAGCLWSARHGGGHETGGKIKGTGLVNGDAADAEIPTHVDIEWYGAWVEISLSLFVLEVLHVGVRTWKDLCHVAVFPAHHVRRCSVFSEHLEYLSVTLGLTEMMPLDDKSIAGTGPQCVLAR
jgi:hypothetical protein